MPNIQTDAKKLAAAVARLRLIAKLLEGNYANN